MTLTMNILQTKETNEMKLIKARVTSDEKMQLEKEMIILSGGVVFENKKQDVCYILPEAVEHGHYTVIASVNTIEEAVRLADKL